jgi:hypothetical protein
MIARRARPRFRVLLEIPRTGGWREWGAAAARFERGLAAQEGPPVITARVESEARRGRDYVRIRVSVTVDAPDIGQAAVAAWGAFREAAGEDAAAWDMAGASAEIRPGQAQLTVHRVARGDDVRRQPPADRRLVSLAPRPTRTCAEVAPFAATTGLPAVLRHLPATHRPDDLVVGSEPPSASPGEPP